MNVFKALCAAACLVALAACGGGSSGPAQSSLGTTQLAGSPSSGDSAGGFVSDVPAPTYAYGSDTWLAYERLSRNRTQCGFGPLAQSAQLDQAAAAHVDYVVKNQVITHYETAGLPGYTGYAPKDRAATAGYVGGVGEIFAAGLLIPSVFPHGDVITEMLMNVPYHAVVALEGMRDVGIGYGPGVIVIDPAHRSGTPMQPVSGVLTYPCDGITDVRPSISGEEPSPFPADPPGTEWGPTISVVGHAVRVRSVALTGPNGSVAIKAILGDGNTKDLVGLCTGTNACVVPQPLERGTTYQVHLEGTDAGVPFTKDFSFSTAVY
jgi:hypothetical protein